MCKYLYSSLFNGQLAHSDAARSSHEPPRYCLNLSRKFCLYPYLRLLVFDCRPHLHARNLPLYQLVIRILLCYTLTPHTLPDCFVISWLPWFGTVLSTLYNSVALSFLFILASITLLYKLGMVVLHRSYMDS